MGYEGTREPRKPEIEFYHQDYPKPCAHLKQIFPEAHCMQLWCCIPKSMQQGSCSVGAASGVCGGGSAGGLSISEESSACSRGGVSNGVPEKQPSSHVIVNIHLRRVSLEQMRVCWLLKLKGMGDNSTMTATTISSQCHHLRFTAMPSLWSQPSFSLC